MSEIFRRCGDLTITGSSLVADHDVTLTAGRNLTITTARNTEQSQSSFEQKTSGLFTSGAAITLGKKQQNDDSQSQSATNVGSTVASLHGNVSATAGADYHQTGSQVLTPAGDIDITGRNVVIDTAVDTERHSEQHAFRQSGLTLAVSTPLVTAAQTAQQMSSAAGQTRDARMQALAGATAALAAKTAADQIAADPEHAGGINVSVSIGSAHSQSQSTQAQSSNVGSTVAAGDDVRIRARSDTPGDDQQGNLTVTGSEIAAGHDATLEADGKIILQAAEDTASQHSSNSSSSASLGVGFGIGKDKMGWSVSASASSARGNADGNDVTQQNSHVSAGNTLTLKSGSDTTLDGAVASGNQVTADIGGNLNIASRQDTSTYDSQQHSLGGSLSIGAGISGSVNAGRSKINSDYASVTEQSGIRAGDGGFDVQVKGDTTLTGGAITSTQAAIDQGNNRFHTGGQLALADIDNHAAYDANAVGVNIGTGVSLDGKLAPVGSGAGIGRDSGSANSTTQAAISGIAGNQAARTGDKEAGIGKIFDADKVQKEINAQVQITQAFGEQASKAVGDYIGNQRKTLREQLKNADSDEAKRSIQAQLSDLTLQERVMNVLIGAVTGLGGAAVTKEGLSAAADEMRQLMIEDSRKFAGITDGKTTLSNVSGPSEGVRGDQLKIGGVRVDLDVLCGADNRRCETNTDGTLKVNAYGQVLFNPEAVGGKSLEKYLQSGDAKKMSGLTGGIQGEKGTLFGISYDPGSWEDKLIEAFSGTHDMIGGELSGLYDDQGNIRRGQNTVEKILHDRWAEVAIPLATPFAAAELLPPEVWNAIAIILKAAR